MSPTCSPPWASTRRLGRPAFTPRERRIADVVLSEVAWLHHAGLPGDDHQSVPPLTARQRTVLTLLLHGRTRHDIARQLGLSPHTVHGYTRTASKLTTPAPSAGTDPCTRRPARRTRADRDIYKDQL